ncbi:hypothetical protein [Pseudomonas sp. BIGb0164]|nr:hypothetical protein [Pseudomonas sp. BIGb0164]MCS4249583.1 hypothetical protein [Pseudomonas sp. BIGb0164]
MDIHEIQQRLAGEWAFYYDVYYPTAPPVGAVEPQRGREGGGTVNSVVA